ncbi:MAG: hypothetical protein Q8914_14800, partial [Bacteroidota bacterium]|nr:hypothetical protein [Bacteroidota bacterium]
MKKILLSFLLLMAVVYAKATFTPDPSTLYNIKQLNSGLVIGQNGTTPCLQSAKQKSYQAFYFVPVDGLTDTYYLINADNNYLNKVSNVDWDYWSVIYESAANGANSEWVIVGEADGFRLQLVKNSLYLASDNTTENSGIYCDKTADHVNGVFVAEPAEVVAEYFDVTEKGLELQVEKDYQPYPVHFSTGNIYADIFAKAPQGFTISKSVFTPDDVLNANHNCSFTVSTSAAAGTKGTIYFALGTGSDEIVFDSVQVVSVEKQPRSFIVNQSNQNMVIGNYSTSGIPALTVNVGDTAQQFILRHAYPTLPDSLSYLKDSLYYIIQDGTYNTMAKELSSGWDVIFGAPTKEAIWEIVPEQEGIYSIKNFVTNKHLGADALTADSRLYDDKAFVLNPTAKPYSVWKIVSADQVVVPKIFTSDDGGFTLAIEKDYKAYPIHITTSGIKDVINVKPSAGFTVDKSSYTSEEVAALKGALTINVSSSAVAGTAGNVIFSYGTGDQEINIDTVALLSVYKYARYEIAISNDETLVIGTHSTTGTPALTTKTGLTSQ